MIVACRHPNGLNCGGVIVAGPARVVPRPGQLPALDAPRTYAGYALTEVPGDHEGFRRWADDNRASQLVTEGVVLWAESEPALQLAIFEGRRSGRYAPPADWAGAAGHKTD